jgi:hypothetical protein
VSGDDAEAKKTVTELVASLGHSDVIDLDDISTARDTEMHLPPWARLWTALGTPMFNIKGRPLNPHPPEGIPTCALTSKDHRVGIGDMPWPVRDLWAAWVQS